MIVPNCRQRLTAQDLEFALDVLRAGPSARRAETPDVDRLLDERAVFDALVGAPALLSVSPYFFYYVLVRQILLERGFSDRNVADYVGALLAYFMEGRRLRGQASSGSRSFVYLVDLVEASRTSTDAGTAFASAARVGDVALFLTGIFPDAIYHRQTYGRRLPGIEYYESMGRAGYRSAAQRPPARHPDLAEVLTVLASEFRALRQALNDLSDTYLCMHRGHATSIDRLLRQALYGTAADAEPWTGYGDGEGGSEYDEREGGFGAEPPDSDRD